MGRLTGSFGRKKSFIYESDGLFWEEHGLKPFMEGVLSCKGSMCNKLVLIALIVSLCRRAVVATQSSSTEHDLLHFKGWLCAEAPRYDYSLIQSYLCRFSVWTKLISCDVCLLLNFSRNIYDFVSTFYHTSAVDPFPSTDDEVPNRRISPMTSAITSRRHASTERGTTTDLRDIKSRSCSPAKRNVTNLELQTSTLEEQSSFETSRRLTSHVELPSVVPEPLGLVG